MRFARGDLSRAKLGELLGVHRNTIREWEISSKEPSREILVDIMELLNVNLNWLFSGKGKPFLDDQEFTVVQAGEPDKSISRIVVINRDGK